MQQSLRYKWRGLVSPPTTSTYLCNRCRHKSKGRTKKNKLNWRDILAPKPPFCLAI